MGKRLTSLKKKILASIAVGVLGVLIASICVFQNVAMAATGPANALAASILACVEKGAFREEVTEIKGGTSTFMASSQKVYVPFGFNGSDSKATLQMTCQKVVEKALADKSISMPSPSTNPSDTATFMQSLGYTKEGGANESSSSECRRFTYTFKDEVGPDGGTGTAVTQSICANVENDEIIDTDITVIGEATNYMDKNIKFEYDNKKHILKVIFPGYYVLVDKTVKIDVNAGDSFDGLIDKVKNAIIESGRADFYYLFGAGEYRYHYKLLNEETGKVGTESVTKEDVEAKYTFNKDDDSAKRKITATLAGTSASVPPDIGTDAQYVMYNDYLEKYYVAEVVCDVSDDQRDIYYTEEKGYYQTTSCNADGSTKTCYAKATQNRNALVGGVSNGAFDAGGKGVGFSEVAKWLKDNYGEGEGKLPTCPERSAYEGSTQNNPSTPGKGDDFFDCNSLGDVGAMQWILCPVMNNGQYTASWLDNLTQSWLQIDAERYDNSKVEDVWGYIRNIANVLMILILLVIILSQVTGYGIDNYGIKKMLPKLIIVAIGINLSLYICQIAVDLSNIAGTGLRDMFSSVGITVTGTDDPGPSFFSNMVAGVFASLAAGGPAAVGGASVAATLGAEASVAAIIMVIVFVIVVVIAVMIIFLMLAARDMIVVACIIISPLAFAAYVLPNTQNWFKKWWELFRAALVIFPICGAMVGISNMLRCLFDPAKEYGLFDYAIFAVLPYIGYFLVPMLLNGVISALGKVGGALTSIGNTVKNGTKAAGQAGMKLGQNTNAFKDWQMKNQERRAANVIEKVRRKGSKATDGDLMRAKEAQDLLNKRKLDRYLNTDKDGRFYGLELGDETAESRANAIKESQELRNYSDQYTNLTRGEMGGELTAAITAYNNDRSDENRIRLQAALTAADSKGMNKETLAGLGEIKFDSSNKNDEKILSTLAGASDKVLSQYGIQMNKMANPDYKHKEKDENGVETERELTDEERKISLNDFIRSGSEVKLSKVSSDKGSSWLNAANDDTWGTVSKINPNAVDTQTLITAANNTTDGKVVTEITKLLETRKNAGIQENYNMSAAELTNLKPAIADALRDTGVYKNAVESIRNNPDSAANQQILNSMDPTVRVKLKLDDNSLAEARRTLQVRRNDNNSGQGFDGGAGI